MDQIIHIIIRDKNGIILEEDAYALSSYNEIGIFDVLPLHANFISLVRQKLTLHKGQGQENRDMEIGFGLLRVFQNKVHIYLGLPDPDEEEIINPMIISKG